MSDSEDSKSCMTRYDDNYTSTQSYIPHTAYDWSEQKCLELIRAYRKTHILWDLKDACYYRNNKKTQAWEDIGRSLGVSAEACKNKMTILLSSFRREKSRILHSIARGNDNNVYTSSWFAFKDLAFLMDRESAHKRRTMGEDLADDSPLESVAEQHFTEYPVAKRRRLGKALNTPTSADRVDIEIVDTFTEEHIAPRSPSVTTYNQNMHAPSADEEEMRSFLRFVGNKMRKYDEQTKNRVQHEICNVIFKADQCFYDNNCASSSGRQHSSNLERDPLSKMTTEATDGRKCKCKDDDH